ncbi:MAG: hypothetical protein U5Q03_00870 [Bacteroidota bacterium]|nr:hypothetical protein [Bacteroidota bacterium]
MNIHELREINILGYAGSYLALLFETLSALNYKGIVNIITNEKKKRAVVPFETGINYTEIFYTNVSGHLKSGFIFSSNKPATKSIFSIFIISCGI